MRGKLIAFVLTGALAVGAVAPAHAVTAVGAAVAGTGNFFPGIWITSPVQSVSVSFTAVGVFEPAAPAGVMNCNFSGTESNSSATFSGGCSGTAGVMNCDFNSQRTVLVWIWNGHCSLSGTPNGVAMSATLFIIPTSVNPITSFAVVGEMHAQAATQ
jgi:hypothetical protein